MTPPPSRLDALLAENRRFAGEYRRGLSNHLPMGLVALAGLGADDARLDEFFRTESPRLEPAPPATNRVDAASYRAAVGTHARYGDLLAWFAAERAERGMEATLRRHVPFLLEGVAGAGFHGLIRLAYAVTARNEDEQIAALAYFADTRLPFPTLRAAQAGSSPVGNPPLDLMARIAAMPALAGRSFSDALIFLRLAEAAKLPELAPLVGSIGAPPLDQLARAAAALYAASKGNFSALHVLTATHALRIVAPLLDAEEATTARGHLLAALLATHVMVGAPRPGSDDELAALTGAPPSWDAILPAAIRASEVHVIKLVYSCREEERAYGGATYRRFAATRVGL